MRKKKRDFENIDKMRIAPSRYGGDWEVKDYKELDFDKEEGWQTAIDIFEDRIKKRFLEPIEVIENNRLKAGFAIMALDCLLIETLMQFMKGKKETPKNQVRRYFIEFLTSTAFNQYFDECKASLFYAQVRCGILHQAEVKGSTRLRTDSDLPLVQCSPDGQGLIINRKKFHQKLKEVFKAYINELKDAKPENEIRKNFKEKMDYICKVK